MKTFKYFSIAEAFNSNIAKSKGIDNTIDDTDIMANICNCLGHADNIREIFGHPIYITSGYRCPELNKVIGGKPNSQHLRGEALDITSKSKEGNKKIFEIIKKYGVYDQLIDEHNLSWVHVSWKQDASQNRKQIIKL